MSTTQPEIESNLIEVLSKQATAIPNKKAFAFFKDGETESAHFTFKTLDFEARKIAAKLQSLNLCGERALLLYPSGLEFISAFFGCLYAGIVAVPAYPPQSKRHHLERLEAIITDCNAKAVLGINSDLGETKNWLATSNIFKNLHCIATNNLENTWAYNWQKPNISPDYLAFLQYTSGSTGTPKGVMVSHKNILHNTELVIKNNLPENKEEICVSWLPIYHDMGLIGNIIYPIVRGSSCHFMPPIAFLQQPYKWLHMLSRCKYAISTAPNFAYELCIRRVNAEQKKALNLSNWKAALIGSEPIRAKTLQQFCETFADCGFNKAAMVPCYGLAETTLMATGQSRKDAPVMRSFVANTIKTPKTQVVPCSDSDLDAKTLVSCGSMKKSPFIKSIIVDHETHTSCPNGVIGEIWLQSASNALGYWNKPELSKQTFAAHTTENDQEKFLRTGDLGFIYDDEIFVTGRIKELIIINGRNYYPQDIEYTVQKSHHALKDDAGAAFAIEADGYEQLVIVQEVERNALRNLDAPSIIAAITQNISLQHELSLHACVLIKPATLPKTSSGKIQRRLSQEYFLQNKLKDITIHKWQASVETPNLGVSHASVSHVGEIQTLKCETPRLGVSTTIRWLQDYWSNALHISTVDITTPFTAFGMSSLQAVDLAVALEQQFSLKIDPTIIWEYPTIAKLSAYLLSSEQQNIFPPITPASLSEKQMLSFAEQDCWHAIKQYNYQNPAHNIPLILEIKGALDVFLLEKSLNLLIAQQEVLRTCYLEENGKVIRKIADHVNYAIKCDKISWIAHKKIKQKIMSFQRQSFDFSRAPLMRLQLLRISKKKYYLLFNISHIIVDGTSIGILFKQLYDIYQTLQQNTEITHQKTPLTLSDYAAWQHKIIDDDLCQTQIKYWQQVIVNPETLPLPYNKLDPVTVIDRSLGACQHIILLPHIAPKLAAYSKTHGVSEYAVLLTAFSLAMKNFCQQDTILFKGISNNRKTQQLLPMVGYLTNHFLVQMQLKNTTSFAELVTTNHQILLNNSHNVDVSFSIVLDMLHKTNPALKINTFFNFHDYHLKIALPNISCKINTNYHLKDCLWGDEVDIACDVLSPKLTPFNCMVLAIRYPQQLFTPKQIKKLLKDYAKIIKQNLDL